MKTWVWYRRHPASDPKFPSIRLIAYGEGHVIVRHAGCSPFAMTLVQFLEDFQLDPPEEKTP